MIEDRVGGVGLQNKAGRRYRKGVAVGLSMLFLALIGQPVLAIGVGENNPFNDILVMLDGLQDQIDGLNTAINGKADADHDHDETYYTKSQVDGEIDGLQGQVDELSSGLDGKADASHDHDDAYYTKDEVDDKIADVEDQIGAPQVDRLVSEFTVAAGESVTAGDVVSIFNGKIYKSGLFGQTYKFNDGSTPSYSVIPLSESKFVIVYQDAGNYNYGTAIVGTVLGSTITYGSEYVFHGAATSLMSATALSDSKFVVAYSDSIPQNYGTCIVGDVSGTMISYGSEYTFAFRPFSVTVGSLSSTKFVITFSDQGNSFLVTAIIGDVSGNAIAFGAKNTANNLAGMYVSTTVLSSTTFIVRDMSPNNYGYSNIYAVIGEVTGSSVAFGSACMLAEYGTLHSSIGVLSPTRFVFACAQKYYNTQNIQSSFWATARIGTVSGNAISVGSESTFSRATQEPYLESFSTISISETKFIITFVNRTYGGTSGKAVCCELSGNVVEFGPEISVTSAGSGMSSKVLLSPKFVVATSDSSGGWALIGKGTGGAGYDSIVGIAAESKTAGQTVKVILGGISDVHSGLTPNRAYYLTLQGVLTTQTTAFKIGLAISPTKMLLAAPFF